MEKQLEYFISSNIALHSLDARYYTKDFDPILYVLTNYEDNDELSSQEESTKTLLNIVTNELSNRINDNHTSLLNGLESVSHIELQIARAVTQSKSAHSRISNILTRTSKTLHSVKSSRTKLDNLSTVLAKCEDLSRISALEKEVLLYLKSARDYNKALDVMNDIIFNNSSDSNLVVTKTICQKWKDFRSRDFVTSFVTPAIHNLYNTTNTNTNIKVLCNICAQILQGRRRCDKDFIRSQLGIGLLKHIRQENTNDSSSKSVTQVASTLEKWQKSLDTFSELSDNSTLNKSERNYITQEYEKLLSSITVTSIQDIEILMRACNDDSLFNKNSIVTPYASAMAYNHHNVELVMLLEVEDWKRLLFYVEDSPEFLTSVVSQMAGYTKLSMIEHENENSIPHEYDTLQEIQEQKFKSKFVITASSLSGVLKMIGKYVRLLQVLIKSSSDSCVMTVLQVCVIPLLRTYYDITVRNTSSSNSHSLQSKVMMVESLVFIHHVVSVVIVASDEFIPRVYQDRWKTVMKEEEQKISELRYRVYTRELLLREDLHRQLLLLVVNDKRDKNLILSVIKCCGSIWGSLDESIPVSVKDMIYDIGVLENTVLPMLIDDVIRGYTTHGVDCLVIQDVFDLEKGLASIKKGSSSSNNIGRVLRSFIEGMELDSALYLRQWVLDHKSVFTNAQLKSVVLYGRTAAAKTSKNQTTALLNELGLVSIIKP